MTQFEYLAVLVSVILGLGLTRIIRGVGRMIYLRSNVRLDFVHTTWTIITFLILIINWWTFFQLQTSTVWKFEVYLVIIVWAVVNYFMVIMLYPPGITGDENYGEVFKRNRRWFLGFGMVYAVTDIILKALGGGLFNPPAYLPFVLHFMILVAIGMYIDTIRYHRFLCVYILITASGWIFIARRFLVE